MAENRMQTAKKRIYDYLLSLGQRRGSTGAMRSAMMGVRPFAEALGEKSYKEARDVEQREFLSGEAEKNRELQRGELAQQQQRLDEMVRQFNERMQAMTEAQQWQRQMNLMPYTGPTESMFSGAFGKEWEPRDLRQNRRFQRQLGRWSRFSPYMRRTNIFGPQANPMKGGGQQSSSGLLGYNAPSGGRLTKSWWDIQYPKQSAWLSRQGGFM